MWIFWNFLNEEKCRLESNVYYKEVISIMQITSMTPTYIHIFVNNVKIVIVSYMFLLLQMIAIKLISETKCGKTCGSSSS